MSNKRKASSSVDMVLNTCEFRKLVRDATSWFQLQNAIDWAKEKELNFDTKCPELERPGWIVILIVQALWKVHEATKNWENPNPGTAAQLVDVLTRNGVFADPRNCNLYLLELAKVNTELPIPTQFSLIFDSCSLGRWKSDSHGLINAIRACENSARESQLVRYVENTLVDSNNYNEDYVLVHESETNSGPFTSLLKAAVQNNLYLVLRALIPRIPMWFYDIKDHGNAPSDDVEPLTASLTEETSDDVKDVVYSMEGLVREYYVDLQTTASDILLDILPRELVAIVSRFASRPSLRILPF